MTVVGMATLLLFFSRGGRWGRLNDAASVFLMLALIPVALVLAIIELEVVTTIALVVAALGIGAMLALAVLQSLLVARRVTYEQNEGRRARPRRRRRRLVSPDRDRVGQHGGT